MNVLSGGDGGDRPPPGRRYSKRRSSLSLSPSDMLLFRPPQPTYIASSWPGELCVLGSSVCLALERLEGASKVAIFCHGTSSDLGMSRRTLEILRQRLECHVIAVEYPGYGLRKEEEANEESVNEAVRSVFVHVTSAMGWPRERVIVIGRSLGSGPAARLAREFHPGALFLLAAFTGVKEIAKAIVGDTLASMFSLDQWNNKDEVREASCPTLFLHGVKDEVVPHTHSLDLYRTSKASKKYVGLLFDSDHNRINWRVACDVYARPFMDMACPPGTDRTLGVRSTDVAKLSSFNVTGDVNLLVACAKAAWKKRREAGGVAREAAAKADDAAREDALAEARRRRRRRDENDVAATAAAGKQGRSPPPRDGGNPGKTVSVRVGGDGRGGGLGEGKGEVPSSCECGRCRACASAGASKNHKNKNKSKKRDGGDGDGERRRRTSLSLSRKGLRRLPFSPRPANHNNISCSSVSSNSSASSISIASSSSSSSSVGGGGPKGSSFWGKDSTSSGGDVGGGRGRGRGWSRSVERGDARTRGVGDDRNKGFLQEEAWGGRGRGGSYQRCFQAAALRLSGKSTDFGTSDGGAGCVLISCMTVVI